MKRGDIKNVEGRQVRKKKESHEQRMLKKKKKKTTSTAKKHYSIFRELIQDRGIKVR